MRIAYVINSLEGGGACAPVPAVAAVLQSHGCDVRVFALTQRDGRGLAAMRDAGLSVTLRQGGERDHLAAVRWLNAQIRDMRPGLIWTSLTRATLLGQVAGQLNHVDVVSWQHAAYLKPANEWLLKVRQRRSLLWVADSSSVAALTRRRLGVEEDRMAVWPLFSADENSPRAAPWEIGCPIRIGSLGRLHAVKGYGILIAALARLRDAGFVAPAPIKLVIAGAGGLRHQLVEAAQSAGLHDVHFVGFSEPGAFLTGLHLYVQPSWSEGLCIAAHEAMQAGLPVIGSAVGELPYSIVDGVTGLVVPPGSPDALAEALARLLAKPHQLALMGAAARARVIARFGGANFAQAGGAALARIRSAQRARASDERRGASRGRIDRSAWRRSR